MSFLDKLSKFLPFSSHSNNQEHYFALNIQSKIVEGAIWSIEGNKLEVINNAKTPYEGEADLIDAANFVLDQTLADFPIEPTKILFGVPDYWLQDDNLKEEYAKLLRGLTKELELSPIAYVSTSHAISHFIQKMQGAPATGILVDLADPLCITVVKVGKIIGSKVVKRSDSLPEDIEKGLLQFSDVEVLPSRFLLYNISESDDPEKIKDKILSFSWMQNLPFLHLPKVDILEKAISITSIAFAGASELDPNVSFSEKSFLELEKNYSQENLLHKDKLEDLKEGSNFKKVGFVAGDIEKFDTKFDLDNLEDQPGEKRKDLEQAEDELTPPLDRDLVSLRGGKSPISLNKLSFIFALLPIKKLPKLPLPKLAGFRASLIIPVAILLLLALGYIFLPKAKVSIFIDPRILEKEAEVTVDSTISTIDEANKKIPGKILETSITGSEKGSASGKKKIGDPAKGTVVVYNKTSAPKTLSSGTTLVGPDNLEFSLDSSVNIASQSAVRGGISYGKTTANVTAKGIGPEGNLPAGKELTVKGLSSSDLSAEVDSAFSGGTSKEITVVTSDDQKKLLALATSNLRSKAKEELQKKLEGDLKILEEGLVEDIVKRTFSKNVRDQASEFSVTVTAKYKGTAYSDNDLKTMVAKLVETNVPEGYQLNLSDTETQAEVAKLEDDSRLIFLAKFRAKLMPKLDQEKIKKEIGGKTPEEAASILKKIENVISSEIQINPSLPPPLRRLPLLPQNISLFVEAK